MKETPTTPKDCAWCGTRFYRGRTKSGRIEAIEDWRKRRYCCHHCYQLDHKGERHPRYVDGIRRGHQDGYLRNSAGKYLHRLVMEEKLGRNLESWEHVHHIDGNTTNNDPSNLVLTTNSEHRREHAKEQARNRAGRFVEVRA